MLTRWEFRRLWNQLTLTAKRPAYLAVQVVSFSIVGLILWLLWFLIFILPYNIRNSMYLLITQSGLVGPNAVLLCYGLLSLLVAQQLIKAFMGVPLAADSEPADADLLFPAPIQGHVFFTSKYIRSIPRRLLFFVYALIALQPVIWFFGFKYGLTLTTFLLFLVIVFLLSEIGSITAHILYSLRKYTGQDRHWRRWYRLIFYLATVIGTILLLTPIYMVNGEMVPSAIYNLAYVLVALGTEGYFAYLYYPAIPGVLFGLVIAYLLFLIVARFLSDKITIDLYEDLAIVTQGRGTVRGLLGRLPIQYRANKSPVRAILRKDTVTGIRKPGKALYLAGILVNYAFALFFISLIPTFQTLFPLPPVFIPFKQALYAILLVVIIPLLSITASDPFRGEYGTIYLIRLAPVPPVQFAFIKYLQQLLTPFILAIPFAIYFAVILGDLTLLPIALAIIPHSILLSTIIGVALGSRYPYPIRGKSETPVALMVTYPVISWIAIMPVLVFLLGFIQAGISWTLLGSLFFTPYTIGLTLMLLQWSAHSYIRQE
ncbi:MAG: hypothetical protein ACFE89_08620 [Candidatus Hodarchaeota archaeon]